MKYKTEEKIYLLAQNAQTIKSSFTWHNAMTKRLAALLYAQENKPVDLNAITQCHSLIKSNTGVFSMFRGNMSLCVAAMLSLVDNREELFSNIINVYNILKSAKFYASDYLAVAAYQIAANAAPDNYIHTVNRTKAFYDAMKAHHFFYTGQDDYIFSAMLGLSEIDIATGSEHIEQLYQRLKPEFWDKNGVQGLSQVLVLGGRTDEAADRVLALRDALKERKIRLDRFYCLPSLGVLALLPVDVNTIVEDIWEAQLLLRSQKGFGAFSVMTQELLLLAAAIVASGYAEDIKTGVVTASLSTSITSIIIAQQAAIIAATSSASAAAVASSTN